MLLDDLHLSPGLSRDQEVGAPDLGQAIVPMGQTQLFEVAQVPVRIRIMPALSEPLPTHLKFLLYP